VWANEFDDAENIFLGAFGLNQMAGKTKREPAH
jgi:hypothetical protein